MSLIGVAPDILYSYKIFCLIFDSYPALKKAKVKLLLNQFKIASSIEAAVLQMFLVFVHIRHSV